MTVRVNPVKRMMVVRKIGGKLMVDVQGTVRVPIKLKPISVPAPRTRIASGSVEMDSLHTSSL